jgi:hypothetical protein
MSGQIKRGRWLRLVVPGLMAVALALGAASTASASGLAPGDAVPQAAHAPAQEGEDGDNNGQPGEGRPDREGRHPRPKVRHAIPQIANAICENQGLFTDTAALPTLCALYQGDLLPDGAKRSLAGVIVKYVKDSQPEAFRTLVEALDIERPDRPEGEEGDQRPPFGRGRGRGPGEQGQGQQNGFGQDGQPQS